MRASNIRHKPDPTFRHGDLAAFAHDPVRAMTRHTNAATHGKALHQSNIRFGIGRDLGIQAVFVGPEPLAIGNVSRAPAIIEVLNIAPRAERTFADRVNENHQDIIVIAPPVQRGLDLATHVISYRVQGMRAVKRDPTRVRFGSDMDVSHGHARPKACER